MFFFFTFSNDSKKRYKIYVKINDFKCLCNERIFKKTKTTKTTKNKVDFKYIPKNKSVLFLVRKFY